MTARKTPKKSAEKTPENLTEKTAKNPVEFYMPIVIEKYLADTMHLTTVLHGAYFLLLVAYWRNGGPLRDDDEELAAITRASAAEWRKMRPRLARFFEVKSGFWRQKRADMELERARGGVSKASAKAASAADIRWERERERRAAEAAASPERTTPDDDKTDAQAYAQAMPEHPIEHENSMLKPCSSNAPLSLIPDPKKGSDSSIELSGAGSAVIEADEIVPPPPAKPSRPPRKPEQPTLDIGGPITPDKADAKPKLSAHEQMLTRVLWDDGLKFLMNRGVSEGSARSNMGKWVSRYQLTPTYEAVSFAQGEGTGDPIALIEATLRARYGNGRQKAGQHGGSGAQGAARTRDQERHDTRLAALAGFGSDGGGGGEPWGDDYGEREYDPGGS